MNAQINRVLESPVEVTPKKTKAAKAGGRLTAKKKLTIAEQYDKEYAEYGEYAEKHEDDAGFDYQPPMPPEPNEQ